MVRSLQRDRAMILSEKEGDPEHDQATVHTSIPVVNARIRNMMKTPLSRQSGALRNEIMKSQPWLQDEIYTISLLS